MPQTSCGPPPGNLASTRTSSTHAYCHAPRIRKRCINCATRTGYSAHPRTSRSPVWSVRCVRLAGRESSILRPSRPTSGSRRRHLGTRGFHWPFAGQSAHVTTAAGALRGSRRVSRRRAARWCLAARCERRHRPPVTGRPFPQRLVLELVGQW